MFKLKFWPRHLRAAFVAVFSVALPVFAQEPVLLLGHTGTIIPASAVPKATAQQKADSTVLKSTGITWNVTYQDEAGKGFNHATLGATRKATLNAVLTYVGGVLNHPGSVANVQVQASEEDGGGPLATAGTFYALSSAYDPGDAYLRIVNKQDRFSGHPEVTMTVDFGYNWNSSLAAPTGGQFDLFSVLLHEVTHALGISSLANSNGTSQFQANSVTFTTFDNRLHQTSPRIKAWSASRTYQLGSSGLFQGANTLHFEGTRTSAVFGGNPPVHTPSTWQNGSSVSHWQLTSPVPSTAVMRPSIAANVQNRVYQPFEIAALQDLGYTIATAPSSAVEDWKLY